MNSLKFWSAVFLILTVSVGFIRYYGLKLAKNNGSDVRTVWYLFSLALTATLVITIWAKRTGAIDDAGTFQGPYADTLNFMMHFVLDLTLDVILFSVISALVLVPQFLGYVLSGIFGCASKPIFVTRAISFAVWGIVKSAVVASGAMSGILALGLFNRFPGFNARGSASITSMIGLLLMFSFFILHIHSDFRDVVKSDTKSTRLPPRPVYKMRAFFTRNESES